MEKARIQQKNLLGWMLKMRGVLPPLLPSLCIALI
jgi:hypothetical protein